MSDLFGNLAEAANGARPQVRPQLGSRFGAPPPLAGEDLPAVREAAGLPALTLPALVPPDGARAELPPATLRQMRLAVPLEDASSLQPALEAPADDAGMQAELPASDNGASAAQFTANEPSRDATMRSGGPPLARYVEQQATEPAAVSVPRATAAVLQSPNASPEVADDAPPERPRADQPVLEIPFARDMAAGRDGPTMHIGADASLRPAGVEAAPRTANAPAPTSPVVPASELPRPEAAPEPHTAAYRLSSHSSATEYLAPLGHEAAPEMAGTRGNERTVSSPSETGAAEYEPPRASANILIVPASSVDRGDSGMRTRAAAPQGDNGLQKVMGIPPGQVDMPRPGAVVPSQPIVREQTPERQFSSQAPAAQSAPASITPAPETPTVLSAELSMTSGRSSAPLRQMPAQSDAPAREASIAPLLGSAHIPERTGSTEAETPLSPEHPRAPRHALAHAGEPVSETIDASARDMLREPAKPREQAPPAIEKAAVPMRDEPIGSTSKAMSSDFSPRETTRVEPASEYISDLAEHHAVPTDPATRTSSRQNDRPAPASAPLPRATAVPAREAAPVWSNDAPAPAHAIKPGTERVPAQENHRSERSAETTVAPVPPHERQSGRVPTSTAVRAASEQVAFAQTRVEPSGTSSPQNGAPVVAGPIAPNRRLKREPLIEPAARQPMSREQSPHVAVERSAIQPALKPSAQPAGIAPQRGAHTETPAAQPTIRVSIGRVEVWAIEPPQPPPRRPNRAPAGLSLDAYMRGDLEGV